MIAASPYTLVPHRQLYDSKQANSKCSAPAVRKGLVWERDVAPRLECEQAGSLVATDTRKEHTVRRNVCGKLDY